MEGRDHVSLLCVAKRNLSLYWLCPRKPQSQVTQVSEHSGKRWAPCRLRATFPDDTWRLPWGSGPSWTAAILGGGHLCPHKVWQILLPAHLERSEGFLKEHREPQGNQGDVPFLTMCHGTERLGQWEVAPTIASDEEKWKEQERDTTKGEWAWKTSPRIRILHSSSDQWYTVHLQWFELKRRWRGSFRNGTSGSLVRREVVKKKFGCKCCHVLQALLTLHSKKKSRDLTLDCC